MLLKLADDHGPRLQLLESLEAQKHWNTAQREWLRSQLWALRRGISGERGAAYYIDHAYKASTNLAVLHDLRLEWGGEVAQIDHLILSRGMVFYLLETKSFSGDVHINAHGEFSVRYGAEMRGIPSPLEQSKRHEKLLMRYLEHLGIGGRLGVRPQFFHAVLLDPKGNIRRPARKDFDTSNVIKADQFEAWRNRLVDERTSMAQVFKGLVNLRSSDTLRSWGQQLAQAHRPLPSESWLPEFMRAHMREPEVKADVTPVMAVAAPAPAAAARSVPVPSPEREDVCAVCQQAVSAEVAAFCRRQAPPWGGQVLCRTHQDSQRAAVRAEPAVAQVSFSVLPPVCASCGCTLSAAVAQFCQSQPQRFAGKLYCMEHQRAIVAPAAAEVAPAGTLVAPEDGDRAGRRQCKCADCGSKITFAEAKFCWGNARRFGGLQYCRAHQANYR